VKSASKPRWARWGVAAAASLSMILAACGSSPTTAPTTAHNSISLVGGIATEPNWWFPITPVSYNSTSNDVNGLMWKGLFFVTKNDTIDFSRSIAESVSVSNNDQTYTIKFNPKWHWSNGTPVTAYDSAFAWQIYKDSSVSSAPWENSSVGSTSFDSIKSVVAKNASTLVVTVDKPSNPTWVELNVLGYPTPVPVKVWNHYPDPSNPNLINPADVNKELLWLERVGQNPSAPQFKVIDGPYFVSKFVHNSYWTMVWNPNYDGHKATIHTLVYEYDTADSSVLLALKSGQYAEATLPSEYTSEATKLPGYRAENYGYVISFNLLQPNYHSDAPVIGSLMNKLYFRQALQMGINQQEIASKLYDGFATPNCTVVAKEPANPYYDKNVTCYPYDPAAGLKLMEQHGWTLNSNHVLTRNGVTLSFPFLVMSGSQTDTNIEQYLKQSWAKEGIDVTLDQMPFTQMIGIVTNPAQTNKWDLAWWGAGWYEGEGYPSTSLYLTGAANNFGGWSSSEMDTLAKAVYDPGTPAQAQQRLDAYEEYAAKNLPVLMMPEYVGVGTPAPYRVVKTWLHGVSTYHSPVNGGSEPWRWTTSGTKP
jgi:peptide/nickel transport system substrate-binding protein